MLGLQKRFSCDKVTMHLGAVNGETGLIVALTFALIAINEWNRLATAFRMPAGTYQPRAVQV